MGIDRTVGNLVTLQDVIALGNPYSEAEGNQVSLLVACLLVENNCVVGVLALLKAYDTVDLTDNREALGLSRLEELLDTGKTLCDILCVSDTARMEGTHCKLCTGLTD